MSRIDDLEKRLAALEGGSDIAARVARIEAELGIAAVGSVVQITAGVIECKRCGNYQGPEGIAKCQQQKCPLK